MRLLVVEDDVDVQQIIRDALSSDFEITTAGRLSEAREQINKSKFNAVVLDLNLPDGNGLEFCQLLRSDRRFSTIPVVILSSRGAVEDRISGLKVGALDYV